MKLSYLIKALPAGSPAGEILKIATLITATVLVDKIGEVVNESKCQYIAMNREEDE